MTRSTINQIQVDPNVRCVRVYPVEESTKVMSELKTIGIKLTSEQAIHLARVLLVASQNWVDMEITAYRTTPRQQDSTYQVTVTSSE